MIALQQNQFIGAFCDAALFEIISMNFLLYGQHDLFAEYNGDEGDQNQKAQDQQRGRRVALGDSFARKAAKKYRGNPRKADA